MPAAEEPEVGSLEWIQFRKLQNSAAPVDRFQKLKDKVYSNPFVPIGVIGTVAALCVGLASMVQGNVWRSQMSMRWRVGCQAFAIGACVIGLELQREKEKEKEQLEAQAKTEGSDFKE